MFLRSVSFTLEFMAAIGNRLVELFPSVLHGIEKGHQSLDRRIGESHAGAVSILGDLSL